MNKTIKYFLYIALIFSFLTLFLSDKVFSEDYAIEDDFSYEDVYGPQLGTDEEEQCYTITEGDTTITVTGDPEVLDFEVTITTTGNGNGNGNGGNGGTPPPPTNGGGCTEEEPLPVSPPPVSPPPVSPPPVSPPSGDDWGTPPSNGGYTPPAWTPPVSPPPPPKYSCNQSTWTCYQNSSGPYSSLSSCQSACVEPPCMINYFEFPKRAWVGYSITGRWSASDWCEDCDVTCSPYPECVWKQNNIGIGWDEHKFTLEQSGDYTYTLTCYKQGGRDQKQVTVTLEALNLPWWREIIPVLPGFLRGIWE